MTRTHLSWPSLLLLLLVAPGAARGQDRLTLPDAQARAASARVEIRAADRGIDEAAAQVSEARAGFLPRVDAVESWQRGNLPVFAFSALLSQRRFTAADFDVNALNHPAAMDDFRAALMVEQSVFDASLRPALQQSELGEAAARAARRAVGQQVSARTVEAYGSVQRLDALVRAATAAVEAAEEDAQRARNRRDAGLATDADVLTVDVHRAGARSQLIDAQAWLGVARARLNDLIGAPLDAFFILDPMPTTSAGPVPAIADLEAEALTARPDIEAARIAVRAADAGVSAARASFLPVVVARGASEWNGAAFGTRASGWLAGVEARVNLFRGFGDRARLAAARATLARRDVERHGSEDRARLEVRAALAQRSAAAQRLEIAKTAVDQARETQRIIRDRYDNGMADVVALLRAAEALSGAEAQRISAGSDLAAQQAALELALGR